VPNIVEQLTRLVEGGIRFHGQMVIVPGLNDGEILEQSLRDLYSFGESCLSVALVPVGLTQFSHLYSGESMNVEHARRLLTTAEAWGDHALRERGERWVYGSDELYLLAGTTPRYRALR
jgi:NifB/MoaA-like Fe-S oxidoreductase